MAHAETRPIVAGVGISHPERVLFPGVNATKLDLSGAGAARLDRAVAVAHTGRLHDDTVPSRRARVCRDPWKAYWSTKQRLPRLSIRTLQTL
jgi:hypothetical protein